MVLARLRERHACSRATTAAASRATTFLPGRWDLLPEGRYMWASVQTVRGCPKHCSFCSVWRTDGQKPRQRTVDSVLERDRRPAAPRLPLHRARRRQLLPGDARGPAHGGAPRQDPRELEQLQAIRAERFELMAALAQPAGRHRVLHADHDGSGRGSRVPRRDAQARTSRARSSASKSVTPEGLKDVYKGFNESGDALVARLQQFREHGVHVLGSFIFGLPSDRAETFDATLSVAERADLTFAQFVMLTPFPGHARLRRRGKRRWEQSRRSIDGIPVSRHWLIPAGDSGRRSTSSTR